MGMAEERYAEEVDAGDVNGSPRSSVENGCYLQSRTDKHDVSLAYNLL